MLNFRHHGSARRRELARSARMSQSQLGKWLSSSRHELGWAALFASILVLLGSASIFVTDNAPRYALNELVPYSIAPRVEFRAIDSAKAIMLKTDAERREPAIYDLNKPYFQSLKKRLDRLTQWGVDPAIESLSQVPESAISDYGLTAAALSQLKQATSSPEALGLWNHKLESFINGLARLPILRDDQATQESDPADRAPAIITQLSDSVRIRQPDMNILGVQSDINLINSRVSELASIFPQPLQATLSSLVLKHLAPFYVRNDEATQQVRKSRYASELPKEEVYYTDRAMIKAGSRLTTSDLDLLRIEQATYLKSFSATQYWMRILGHTGVVLLIVLGLWSYILAYNIRVAQNPWRGAALMALLLVCQSIAVICTTLTPEYIFAAATAPTLLASIILAIVYDQRFAMAVGAFQTMLVALCLGLSVETTLIILTGVGVAVLQLDQVRTRSKLVLVGWWTGVVMGVATLCVGLARQPLFMDGAVATIFIKAAYAFATPFLTGLFANGILPPIEKIFKVTTAMSLKDLNDASHPLLQRLAQEAPGTYRHSLRISDMAQSAAEAIGANALLCAVGAMYHDIGKINKPAYFVENQGGDINRHQKLSPAISLLIIVGHVKDGIEMAREYGLPPVIRHFIESHHGTTLVEYFYHAARQKSSTSGIVAPAEFEYRYPGPKPQTREAAILMLCDTIEGAARAMTNPTPARLEQLVHQMSQKRLQDGQFDACNLTLKDLQTIEQAITKTLQSIHHRRIKYPSANETDAQSSTDRHVASASTA